ECLGAGDHRVRGVVRAELFMLELGPRLVLHVTPTPVQRVAQMLGSACHVWRHNPDGSPPNALAEWARRAVTKAHDTPGVGGLLRLLAQTKAMMPQYLAALTIVLLIGTVLGRALLLRRSGTRSMLWGKLKKAAS